MYYFDNKYLAQYLDQRVKLSVYVDYEWLDVADKTDVTDKLQGESGHPSNSPLMGNLVTYNNFKILQQCL